MWKLLLTALTPPVKLTAILPTDPMRLVPLIVNVSPTFTVVGVMLEMFASTDSCIVLVTAVCPVTVILTVEVDGDQSTGIATVNAVAVAERAGKLCPTNVIVSSVFVVLKPVPEIVTMVPAVAWVGVMPVIVTASAHEDARSAQTQSADTATLRRIHMVAPAD